MSTTVLRQGDFRFLYAYGTAFKDVITDTDTKPRGHRERRHEGGRGAGKQRHGFSLIRFQEEYMVLLT